ncbi:hypothetical protein, partial [Pseudomonas viridiflava]|uniref:hypothetical protein n=1 Tax=Pseudomonas viridiflava TaxID=33069 RepID=UPI00197EAFE4
SQVAPPFERIWLAHYDISCFLATNIRITTGIRGAAKASESVQKSVSDPITVQIQTVGCLAAATLISGT